MSSSAAEKWSGNFKELEEKQAKLRRLFRYHLKVQYERGEAETEVVVGRDSWRAKTILSLEEAGKKFDRFLKTNRPRMSRRESEDGNGEKHHTLNRCLSNSSRIAGSWQGEAGGGRPKKKHAESQPYRRSARRKVEV